MTDSTTPPTPPEALAPKMPAGRHVVCAHLASEGRCCVECWNSGHGVSFSPLRRSPPPAALNGEHMDSRLWRDFYDSRESLCSCGQEWPEEDDGLDDPKEHSIRCHYRIAGDLMGRALSMLLWIVRSPATAGPQLACPTCGSHTCEGTHRLATDAELGMRIDEWKNHPNPVLRRLVNDLRARLAQPPSAARREET